MTVLVATTLHAYVMDDPDTWGAWLYTAEEMAATSDVRFFAAIETDARGLEPFEPLLERLRVLNGDFWTFRFDDGAEEITTANRLRRITMGQNITSRYCLDNGFSHLLFMAADCCPPSDAVEKLLEMHWPIVGGEVPTYCLSGPVRRLHPHTGQQFGFDVEEHMATAAFVMIQRELLKKIHWRYDHETGMTDDPCLHADCLALGFPTLVRKDVLGQHFPESIGGIETRGHDRMIRR